MTTITLTCDWTYLTPALTIDYRAGIHEVADEIALAAEAAGVTVKDEGNGDSPAAPAPARASRPAKG